MSAKPDLIPNLTESPAAAACLNCGAPFAGPYCASCGQRKPHLDLTLREFVNEATAELTHLDGKLPTTLRALFFRPGLLTQDFLSGRRARWLPPLRLYLICSIAYFLSGPLTEAITHRSAREVAKVTVTNPDGSTTLTPASRDSIALTLPGRLFGPERIERAVAKNAELNRVIESAFPKAMFLLLPLFAWLTNIAWRSRMPRYPAHLYLALHLHAAWFGGLAVMTVATMFVTSQTTLSAAAFGTLIYIVWYGLISVRRVLGDSWGRTVAKAIAIGAVYAVSLMTITLGLLAYAIYRI